MSVLLRYPSRLGRESERIWIAGVVLSRLFDDFQCIASDGLEWVLEDLSSQVSTATPRLRLPDTFFSAASDKWLKPESVPCNPLANFNPRAFDLRVSLLREEIPVLFGKPEFVHNTNGEACLGIDIFGSAFFMLSRYEEVARPQLDVHGRFPAKASLAFNAGFLDRPIIDEYIEILWGCLSMLWPHLKRRASQFEMMTSHDVDNPSRYAFQSLRAIIRESAGDALKRNDWTSAVRGPWQWLYGQFRLHPRDIFNTFDWIMDRSHLLGLKSTFFFASGTTDVAFDPDYSIQHLAIRRLLHRIHLRGHQIGLHPSYSTFRNGDLLKSQFDHLKDCCAKLGIHQQDWGVRMHYLQWSTPATMRALDHAGLAYDSTLGFADCCGFRCGTAHEYPGFDVEQGKQLRIRIRPLVAMDVTVMSPDYMGLGETELAYNALVHLKDACRYSGGMFTLLWHNNELCTAAKRDLYERVITA